MSNKLTERQWEAHIWLSRAWDKEREIDSYKMRMDKIISQLSGIGKYDAEYVPSQTGENSVETQNLEYSSLCEKIEKRIHDISIMNLRTGEVIDKVNDRKMHDMLYDRYINRMSWKQIGNKYHYAQRQPFNYMHKCLDEVRPFISDEEIKEAVYDECD